MAGLNYKNTLLATQAITNPQDRTEIQELVDIASNFSSGLNSLWKQNQAEKTKHDIAAAISKANPRTEEDMQSIITGYANNQSFFEASNPLSRKVISSYTNSVPSTIANKEAVERGNAANRWLSNGTHLINSGELADDSSFSLWIDSVPEEVKSSPEWASAHKQLQEEFNITTSETNLKLKANKLLQDNRITGALNSYNSLLSAYKGNEPSETVVNEIYSTVTKNLKPDDFSHPLIRQLSDPETSATQSRILDEKRANTASTYVNMSEDLKTSYRNQKGVSVGTKRSEANASEHYDKHMPEDLSEEGGLIGKDNWVKSVTSGYDEPDVLSVVAQPAFENIVDSELRTAIENIYSSQESQKSRPFRRTIEDLARGSGKNKAKKIQDITDKYVKGLELEKEKKRFLKQALPLLMMGVIDERRFNEVFRLWDPLKAKNGFPDVVDGKLVTATDAPRKLASAVQESRSAGNNTAQQYADYKKKNDEFVRQSKEIVKGSQNAFFGKPTSQSEKSKNAQAKAAIVNYDVESRVNAIHNAPKSSFSAHTAYIDQQAKEIEYNIKRYGLDKDWEEIEGAANNVLPAAIGKHAGIIEAAKASVYDAGAKNLANTRHFNAYIAKYGSKMSYDGLRESRQELEGIETREKQRSSSEQNVSDERSTVDSSYGIKSSITRPGMRRAVDLAEEAGLARMNLKELSASRSLSKDADFNALVTAYEDRIMQFHDNVPLAAASMDEQTSVRALSFNPVTYAQELMDRFESIAGSNGVRSKYGLDPIKNGEPSIPIIGTSEYGQHKAVLETMSIDAKDALASKLSKIGDKSRYFRPNDIGRLFDLETQAVVENRRFIAGKDPYQDRGPKSDTLVQETDVVRQGLRRVNGGTDQDFFDSTSVALASTGRFSNNRLAGEGLTPEERESDYQNRVDTLIKDSYTSVSYRDSRVLVPKGREDETRRNLEKAFRGKRLYTNDVNGYTQINAIPETFAGAFDDGERLRLEASSFGELRPERSQRPLRANVLRRPGAPIPTADQFGLNRGRLKLRQVSQDKVQMFIVNDSGHQTPVLNDKGDIETITFLTPLR